jgi:hypothetical protein
MQLFCSCWFPHVSVAKRIFSSDLDSTNWTHLFCPTKKKVVIRQLEEFPSSLSFNMPKNHYIEPRAKWIHLSNARLLPGSEYVSVSIPISNFLRDWQTQFGIIPKSVGQLDVLLDKKSCRLSFMSLDKKPTSILSRTTPWDAAFMVICSERNCCDWSSRFDFQISNFHPESETRTLGSRNSESDLKTEKLGFQTSEPSFIPRITEVVIIGSSNCSRWSNSQPPVRKHRRINDSKMRSKATKTSQFQQCNTVARRMLHFHLTIFIWSDRALRLPCVNATSTRLQHHALFLFQTAPRILSETEDRAKLSRW